MGDNFIRDGSGNVAACLGCQIHSHRARLHGLDHVQGDQLGSLLARDEGSRDDDVHLLGLLPKQRRLRSMHTADAALVQTRVL